MAGRDRAGVGLDRLGADVDGGVGRDRGALDAAPAPGRARPLPAEQAAADGGAGEALGARDQEVGQAGGVGEVGGVGPVGAEVVGLGVLGEDGHGLAPAAAAPPADHPDRLGRVGAVDPVPVDPLVAAGPVAVDPGRGPRAGKLPGTGRRRAGQEAGRGPLGAHRGGQPAAPQQEPVHPGHHHGQGHRGPQQPVAGNGSESASGRRPGDSARRLRRPGRPAHRAPGVVTLTWRSARAAVRAAAQWRPATVRRRWRGTATRRSRTW